MTNEQIAELEGHAREWDNLALAEPHDEVGRNRADMYRRTAESFRIEIRTGIPVCVCCHKPYPKPGRY